MEKGKHMMPDKKMMTDAEMKKKKKKMYSKETIIKAKEMMK